MRRRIDWPTIRAAYINGSESLAQLARRFAVRADIVRAKAAAEKWTEQRAGRQHRLLAEATEQSIVDCAAELVKLNSQHLVDAREVWGRIMGMIRADGHDAHDIRALVSALTDCQKVARLSLGASVTNEILNPPPPSEPEIDLSKLDDQELEQFSKLLEKCGAPPPTVAPRPGGLQ